MSNQSGELLTHTLRSVSRSFYLTLRVLPRVIRPQVSLAYLLARIADTIADTDLIATTERVDVLGQWRDTISGTRSAPIDLRPFVGRETDSAENLLLDQANNAALLLDSMPENDAKLIRTVLDTIISGQLLDLERFQDSSKGDVTFLATESDLDDYIYRVAGCVGEFWTHICFRHLGNASAKPPESLLDKAVQFGKGLQLVNVLRDLATDYDQGRCYLPDESIDYFEISKAHWGHDPNMQRMIEHFLAKARLFLNAGWNYTVQLPASWRRVRLACAWPILIANETLDALPIDDPFNPARRAKISRKRVHSIMTRTVLYQPFPKKWNRLGQVGSDPAPRTAKAPDP